MILHTADRQEDTAASPKQIREMLQLQVSCSVLKTDRAYDLRKAVAAASSRRCKGSKTHLMDMILG